MESGGGRAKTSLEEDDDRIEGRAAKTLVFLICNDDPRSDPERIIPRRECGGMRTFVPASSSSSSSSICSPTNGGRRNEPE